MENRVKEDLDRIFARDIGLNDWGREFVSQATRIEKVGKYGFDEGPDIPRYMYLIKGDDCSERAFVELLNPVLPLGLCLMDYETGKIISESVAGEITDQVKHLCTPCTRAA